MGGAVTPSSPGHQPDRVLVVEDDPATRAALTGYFEEAGYHVTEARDGAEFWSALESGPVDLILLDVKLPGNDGFDLLRQLRRISEIAVILVTGRRDDIDRIVGLELGAHDYVTKPFNMRELLARSKNLIRLTRGLAGHGIDRPRHSFDGWEFDVAARRLSSPAGEEIALTRGEFDLLAALLENAGRVMTRESLLDHVSHRDWEQVDRTIDVLVGRIRRKIEDDPKRPKRLMTVRGVGYIFTPVVRTG